MSEVNEVNSIGKQINLQAIHAITVVPSDTTVLPASTVYVGVAGNVAVTTVQGDVVTFVGMAAGTILPVLVTKVMSTNTTATTMIALS